MGEHETRQELWARERWRGEEGALLRLYLSEKVECVVEK